MTQLGTFGERLAAVVRSHQPGIAEPVSLNVVDRLDQGVHYDPRIHTITLSRDATASFQALYEPQPIAPVKLADTRTLVARLAFELGKLPNATERAGNAHEEYLGDPATYAMSRAVWYHGARHVGSMLEELGVQHPHSTRMNAFTAEPERRDRLTVLDRCLNNVQGIRTRERHLAALGITNSADHFSTLAHAVVEQNRTRRVTSAPLGLATDEHLDQLRTHIEDTLRAGFAAVGRQSPTSPAAQRIGVDLGMSVSRVVQHYADRTDDRLVLDRDLSAGVDRLRTAIRGSYGDALRPGGRTLSDPQRMSEAVADFDTLRRESGERLQAIADRHERFLAGHGRPADPAITGLRRTAAALSGAADRPTPDVARFTAPELERFERRLDHLSSTLGRGLEAGRADFAHDVPPMLGWSLTDLASRPDTDTGLASPRRIQPPTTRPVPRPTDPGNGPTDAGRSHTDPFRR